MNTKRNFTILTFSLLIFILFCSVGIDNSGLRITYLGNCGFLYEAAGEKVLIDPFGTEYGNYFQLPSTELQRKIIDREDSFNKVDLLLITHIHGDHFNFKLSREFLLSHRDAKMICPPQVLKQMQDSCANFEQIKDRIISPELSMGEAKFIRGNNIPVQVIRMQHGTMRNLEGINPSEYTDYEKTENYGYVVNLNDKNIFHQGDGCLMINKKALEQITSKIDVAHLSYFDWDSISYKNVKNQLHANKVIFMHGTIAAKELERKEFKKILPELVVLKKEMETVYFD